MSRMARCLICEFLRISPGGAEESGERAMEEENLRKKKEKFVCTSCGEHKDVY